MDVVILIGRIVFALLFVGSGMGHLTKSAAMTGYAESKGLPFAKVAVLGSGVLIIVAGLMVALGVWADLGSLVLVPFLLATAVLFHAFWKETDEQMQMNEQAHFMKDIGLAGAALMLFALFATADVGLMITGPLFG